jgi:hypothetical protein
MVPSAEETFKPGQLGPHFVAFIDHLGQRERLDRLPPFPRDTQERDLIRDSLVKAAQPVLRIRNWFESYIEQLTTVSPGVTDGMTPEQRQGFLDLRALHFDIVTFSDSVVIAIPIRVDQHNRMKSAVTVGAAIQAIAQVMLTALAHGMPLRGGIDAGTCLRLTEHEVYGRPLLGAYRLESTVAEYPRVAVGDGLVTLLEFLRSSPVQHPSDEEAARIANDCFGLLCQAPDDGQLMLHFLSSEITTITPQFAELPPKALSWIDQQLTEFRQSGNDKLARRYTRLRRYFAVAGHGRGSVVEGSAAQEETL